MRPSQAKRVRRARICIVEDDVAMRRLLRNIFERGGYAVSEAANDGELRTILKTQKIDLVTLDLTLPGSDGLSIARVVRTFSDVPIIMVTARAELVDRLVGLEMGADDYIVKPFNAREVVARVRAVLRRTSVRSEKSARGDGSEVRFGTWVLDVDGHELRSKRGTVCPLTTAEFRLLEAFVRHPGRVLSRDYLIDTVGGIDAEPLERSIDTTVSRLRRKIEKNPALPQFIKTVRGAGYRFTGHLI